MGNMFAVPSQISKTCTVCQTRPPRVELRLARVIGYPLWSFKVKAIPIAKQITLPSPDGIGELDGVVIRESDLPPSCPRYKAELFSETNYHAADPPA